MGAESGPDFLADHLAKLIASPSSVVLCSVQLIIPKKHMEQYESTPEHMHLILATFHGCFENRFGKRSSGQAHN